MLHPLPITNIHHSHPCFTFKHIHHPNSNSLSISFNQFISKCTLINFLHSRVTTCTQTPSPSLLFTLTILTCQSFYAQSLLPSLFSTLPFIPPQTHSMHIPPSYAFTIIPSLLRFELDHIVNAHLTRSCSRSQRPLRHFSPS